MNITIHERTIELLDGGVLCVAKGPMTFAHLGLMTLRNWAKTPDKRAFTKAVVSGEVYTDCGRQKATERLGQTLAGALEAHPQINGIDLWDTMSNGSDYWRPGKLLSDAVRNLDTDVAYRKHDDLCPDQELLKEFYAVGMSFEEYAPRYAASLEADGSRRLLTAVAAVVLSQARGRLALFCCTDPYIPGYADPAELFSDIPMGERSWCQDPAARSSGCHRVVLADRIGNWFVERGVGVRMLEPDVTAAVTKVRKG